MFLGVVLVVCAGCGGGTTSQTIIQPPPPAPAPDFSVALSSNSLSVSQGATSNPINVTVTAQNGFNGTVQVSFTGMPEGIIYNPPGAFTAAAGTTSPVVFGASRSAATGNFTIVALAANGALSHSANFTLTVQPVTGPQLPRTAYARTDAMLGLDDPVGEPHHRHLVYDPASKRLFVANRAMNRVEVFATPDLRRIADISVPGATSVDLSADGLTLWVGTMTEQAIALDPASLRVKSRQTIPSISPIPNTVFNRPEELLALANGNVMIRLRQSESPQALLALWRTTSNALTNLTSTAPQLFQSGLGPMARTADRLRVVVAANDSSGQIALFDSNGAVLAGPRVLDSGTIPQVAANLDGSRFAVLLVSSGGGQLFLLDSLLNSAAPPVSTGVYGLSFSRDGKFLYAALSAPAAPVIAVFDGNTLQALGQVPGAVIQGIRTGIEEADESRIIFGIANRGVSFIDASNPGTLPASVPSFLAPPVAQAAAGPFTGGTPVSFSGLNFEATAQVKFGDQQASNVNVTNSTQIKADSPASAINGATNVTAYFPSGWIAITPAAFSYGPQIIEVLPNGGLKTGGDVIQIYGFGFGSDASKVSVSIGGVSVGVQKVEDITSLRPALGLDATYPFPLERITLQTPAGNPGKANLIVSSPSGTTTAANSFQYLQSVQVQAKPGVHKFVNYDQKRQWVYLSNIDHLDVFDLAAGNFRVGGINPPGGPPPTAQLRGVAVTPDGSQLVIADFGSRKIYLMNPDTATGSTVALTSVPGFANSGPARVAPTSAQTVFVGLAGACSTCLAQLNLAPNPPTIEPAPQPQVTTLTGSALVQANTAGDRVFLAYNSNPGGPVGIWQAATPNQFATSLARLATNDLAASADGTAFATRTNSVSEFRGADLAVASALSLGELERLPAWVAVPGITLHPSGALIYQPFLTGRPPAVPPITGIRGGVDILDAHTGRLRLRLFLPEPYAMLSSDTNGLEGGFLAIDESGQRIFALSASGLTIVDLGIAPLGIGTISPATGTAAGGVTVTIRGSGFQPGASVNIGGRSSTVTFKDVNTLTIVTPATSTGPQQVVITNPDGESVALDAAFLAN